MEQKYLKDFILSRAQQMLVAIFLLSAILASSILILRRIKEERQFARIEVVEGQIPNFKSEIRNPKSETNPKSKIPDPKQLQNPKSKININRANLNELIGLPGIGENIGREIIKYRKENGTFTSLKEIMKVKGIEKKKFEKCKDMIRVD
ncbi:MAG: helix-hairpin-helix domain-containing protein [bacterium]